MKKRSRLIALLPLLLVVLFAANLFMGSVRIPSADVVSILSGETGVRESWRFIVLQSRLPQAITATLCGGALAACGLMLQTAFRNPLAGPSIFGISSGAGLGVALVMLLMGGSLTTSLFTATGFAAVVLAAFVGAMAVTGLIFAFSQVVRNSVMLLIVGVMTGYLSNSVISLLNFFATEEGVKSYMVWGMGNFGGVSMDHMPLFATVMTVAILSTFLFVKPLNTLLLGEQYAESLGVDTRRVRNALLAVTGLLTAVTTAFCGPVAFIGLAVPHMARLLLGTDNHRLLLPATVLTGSVVALACNMICSLPASGGILPLNAVTPLIGAPVIIYVIVRQR